MADEEQTNPNEFVHSNSAGGIAGGLLMTIGGPFLSAIGIFSTPAVGYRSQEISPFTVIGLLVFIIGVILLAAALHTLLKSVDFVLKNKVELIKQARKDAGYID